MASKFEIWGKKYGLLLSVVIALLVWFLPMPQGMNPVQHKLLTIFAGAVALWVTQGIGFGTSAFIVCSLLYFWVGNPDGRLDKAGNLVHSADFAIAGFSNSGLWLQQAGFIISIAMIETGVAKRVALHMLRALGKKPFGAILTPMLANMLVAPLTPSNTARTTALLPVVEGVAEAYKAERGGNFGKALFIANTMSSNITASAFMTGTVPNPMAVTMIIGVAGASAMTSWGYWAIVSAPINMILLVLTVFIVTWLFKPEMGALPGGAEYIDDELTRMGPMTFSEKRAVLYFLIALALWSTDMWHHFNSTYVAFLAVILILAPKIGVLEWKKAERGIPWELYVYFGGVLTLSAALVKTKSIEFVMSATIASLGIQDVGMLPFMILLMGFTIFSHMFWSTTTAMCGVMIPIYIGIAQTFGFPIVNFVLPQAFLMGYAFFFPFNTQGNIIMMGPGYHSITDLFRTGIVVGLTAWALWALAAVFYFPLVGLR